MTLKIYLRRANTWVLLYEKQVLAMLLLLYFFS